MLLLKNPFNLDNWKEIEPLVDKIKMWWPGPAGCESGRGYSQTFSSPRQLQPSPPRTDLSAGLTETWPPSRCSCWASPRQYCRCWGWLMWGTWRAHWTASVSCSPCVAWPPGRLCSRGWSWSRLATRRWGWRRRWRRCGSLWTCTPPGGCPGTWGTPPWCTTPGRWVGRRYRMESPRPRWSSILLSLRWWGSGTPEVWLWHSIYNNQIYSIFLSDPVSYKNHKITVPLVMNWKIIFKLSLLLCSPVDWNTHDVQGGHGRNMDIHSIVQVTHKWPESPISFQETIKPVFMVKIFFQETTQTMWETLGQNEMSLL